MRKPAPTGPRIGRFDHDLVPFAGAKSQRAAGKILGRPLCVIHLGAHHVFQPRHVFRPRPFQIADAGAGADELKIATRRAGLAQ